ncbi:MAG: xylulose kinase, partial [Acidimicrobiales bacterium]|nr:xylulose kinase [Acidimicrobiales bacterium]
MPLVAGVDSSTQSTKVELRDADDGRLVGTGRAPHPVVTPPVAEQDPEAWWVALEAALAEALTAAGATTVDVGAIAVGGQQHGLVALGADDGVLRPAKLWNDTTSAPDADALVAALPGGAAAWAAACGSVPVASFTVTKLAWLRRNEPDVWARLARVCLPHDWLTLRLTGSHVTDRGDASGTGYWSPAEGAYRFDLLALVDDGLDWPAMVPDVLGPAEVAGTWHPAGGGEVLVGPGTGDNMAAAVGIGLAPGDVAVSIGTSGVLTT